MGSTFISTQSERILQWSHRNAVLLMVAFAVALYFKQPLYFVLAAGLSFTFYCFVERASLRALWWGIGRANLLSVGRFCIVSGVVLSIETIPIVLVPILLVLCLILDGFDGYLARRYHEAGEFGHYLDLEIDAYCMAALSYLVWSQESVGGFVLVAGLLRYVYLWIVKLCVTNEKLEPKRRYASVIAITVAVIMIIRLTFDFWVFTYILNLAVFILLLSFARSLWFQWQNK